jgi:predicted transcriptional regulator
MSLTIHLPEEVEARLRRWAQLANQTEEEIVRRALESYLAIPPELREELEGWQQLGAEAIEGVAQSANETW